MLKLNDKFEILTPDGFGSFSGIQKVRSSGRVKITTSLSDEPFICSRNHRLKKYTGDHRAVWVDAVNLSIRDCIMSQRGIATIVSIEYENGEFEFYDLMDTPSNRYYSGGLLSHNCEFIGSTNTLISPETLRNLTWKTPITDNWGVDIYENPIPDHIYVLCADTAHGVGLDYSAFTIMDVTDVPYKLVAKYRSNTATPIFFPEVISRTGRLYNNAYVLAENNDIGMAMVESLHRDLEYDNILSTVLKGRAGQKVGEGFGLKSVLGVKMTKQVKAAGCSNFKDILEMSKLIVTDYEIIQELFTFVSKNLSYQAEEGCNDDLVMTLVMFGWLVRQPIFKEISNTDVRMKLAKERYQNMIDDMLPAGYIDNGEDVEPIGRDNGFWDLRL